MKPSKIVRAIFEMLVPGLTQVPTATNIGAMPDIGSLGSSLAALAANSQSVAGGVVFTASAAASITLTALGNLLLQLTNGGAVTVTVDSAYNIAKTLPQPLTVGEIFGMQVMTNAVTAVATPTLSDTAVTLAGTTAVVAASLRWYQGSLTQVNSTVGMPTTLGTTFTSIAQVGATNNFTVTLGVNTLVPVVGSLIFLAVTTGTLPSGWYPINKVTSATSFVIATPPGTVWTATVATVGTLTVAPATYSPLITLTGLMSTVTNTMAV